MCTCDHVVPVALDLGVEAVEVDVSDHLFGGGALKAALGPQAAKHLHCVLLNRKQIYHYLTQTRSAVITCSPGPRTSASTTCRDT